MTLASTNPKTSARRPSRKGQYFSFDAIIASVIFVLAFSLLTAHWFALRAQIDDQSDYQLQEALRVSDLLLGPGNPVNMNGAGLAGNWYLDPVNAVRAGFGVNGSLPALLNASQLYQAELKVGDVTTSSENTTYKQYQSLLSTGSQFEVIVNTSDNPGACNGVPYSNFSFGRAPNARAADIAQVRRAIVIDDPCSSGAPYYYGNLTLILWGTQTPG